MNRAHSWQQLVPTLLSVVLVIAAVFLVRARSEMEAGRGGRPFAAGGFTTAATVKPQKVAAGSRASITASVTSKATTAGIVNVEVYGAQHERAYQQIFADQELSANRPRQYSVSWDVPPAAPASLDTVKVGVFRPDWTKLAHWNDNAATFDIVPLASRQTRTQADLQPAENPTVSGMPAQQTGPSTVTGANVPWYNWGCDFGCGTAGGASDPGVQSALAGTFGEARSSGMQVMRWWMFEGDAHQITRDAQGSPTGIDPAVYADIDAALRLAQQQDVYFDFVLFSSPTAIPTSWETDPGQRAQLASVLGQLFAHYKDNSRIWSWEVFNEPEFDIWSNKIDQASVQATVKAVADSVHANSTAKVSVGSAMLDGLPLWVGLGLDYYEAHWYDYMSSGNWCAVCTDYATLQGRYHLDAPLIIGEFYGDASANPLQRYTYFSSHGFAGAWPWSLFPDHTNDHMAIDLSAARAFANGQTDTGSPLVASSGGDNAVAAATPVFGAAASAPATVSAGGEATVQVSLRSDATTQALVDVEIYQPDGTKAFQQSFDNQAFVAGQSMTVAASWQVAPSAVAGNYVVKVGIFSPGWATMYTWNDNAAVIAVRGG